MAQWVKSWTDEPVGTVEPIDGWVPVTLLLGLPDTPETLSPAACSAVVACAHRVTDDVGHRASSAVRSRR